ncbi:hypothetical protein DCAR_0205982 [Daucus carota subsp. sativus]|uniref:Uncharacterized protein n=1 Tax=Daucus carota subsp. sativus TaxID=79200 RepID=A0A166CYC9_DAUCS|nr:hypothetical protein DCAR_0205982 [Daucus carota subsp. sativus]
MSKRPPSVWPPPTVWGLGLLGYGYHTCKKIIRIIRIWDTFSFRTPYDAVMNFLLLDTENEEYWVVAPILDKGKLFPEACAGLLYWVHDFKIVHTAPAVNPIKTGKMLLFGMNTGLLDFVGGNSIIPCKLDMCERPMDSSTLENDNVLTGKVYLSSTAATTFDFNPKCAHAMHLSSKVADAVHEFICDVPSETPIQIRGTANTDQLYKSLNALVTETLWAHQKETDPGARKGWRHSSQTIDHGKGPKQLTGMHVNDYIKYYSMAKDVYAVPTRLKKIRGATCSIRVELFPSNYSNTTGNIIIREICQYTQLIKSFSMGGHVD